MVDIIEQLVGILRVEAKYFSYYQNNLNIYQKRFNGARIWKKRMRKANKLSVAQVSNRSFSVKSTSKAKSMKLFALFST